MKPRKKGLRKNVKQKSIYIEFFLELYLHKHPCQAYTSAKRLMHNSVLRTKSNIYEGYHCENSQWPLAKIFQNILLLLLQNCPSKLLCFRKKQYEKPTAFQVSRNHKFFLKLSYDGVILNKVDFKMASPSKL